MIGFKNLFMKVNKDILYSIGVLKALKCFGKGKILNEGNKDEKKIKDYK